MEHKKNFKSYHELKRKHNISAYFSDTEKKTVDLAVERTGIPRGIFSRIAVLEKAKLILNEKDIALENKLLTENLALKKEIEKLKYGNKTV